MGQPSEREWVTIKTTLPVFPLPPNDQRRTVLTDRLILRPFNNDEHDLKGLHSQRGDPEIMQWSVQGRPDQNIEETRQNNFILQVPPNDIQRYNWVICLASTGEIIGNGGNGQWKGELGWPEIGYTLKKTAWGKGYATEFLSAFLQIWWDLPRQDVEIKVEKSTVKGEEKIKEECVVAVTEDLNKASHRVLQKTGFEMTTVWEEEDAHDKAKNIVLCGWTAKKTDKRPE